MAETGKRWALLSAEDKEVRAQRANAVFQLSTAAQTGLTE